MTENKKQEIIMLDELEIKTNLLHLREKEKKQTMQKLNNEIRLIEEDIKNLINARNEGQDLELIKVHKISNYDKQIVQLIIKESGTLIFKRTMNESELMNEIDFNYNE